MCMCVLIFKQHLSSAYINVWSLYTDNVSSPRGSSLHNGHMDNLIPVVELVIKKHTWPLSDSQCTRFLWTDEAANSTEEQFLPQTATGGQAHARPCPSCQMSPDERRFGGTHSHLSAQGALWPVYILPGFIQFHIFSQEESEVFFSSFDIISPLPYLLYYDFLCLL